jgi:ribose/xylose/arabinose/galactoside ABC-type transport system permease subunit
MGEQGTNRNNASWGTRQGKRYLRILGKVWSILFLIVLVMIFSSRGANFFSIMGLQNVLLAATLIMLVAVGETFVVISGGIDISPAYVVGLCGAIGAIIMRDMYAGGSNPAVAVIVGMVGGLAFSVVPGLVNGLIITKMKVPPFIVTIGTMGIAEGAVFLSNGGVPVRELPPLVANIGNTFVAYYTSGHGFSLFGPPDVAGVKSVGILPIPVLMMIVVIAVMWLILSKTIFGQHVYAIGGNIQAARLSGIPVDNVLLKAYMLASLMYGCAGMVYVLRFASLAPNAGEPLLISSIGAVFIGGASMAGGYGTIGGTVIGALIIAVLQTGLVMLLVSPFFQYIALGCAIILAVFVDQFKAKLLQE